MAEVTANNVWFLAVSLIFIPLTESAVTVFGSLKPSNPSFVKERDNVTLKWNYTIDGSIGSVRFSNVTDGSSTIIASKFGAGDVNVGASFQERFTVDISNTLTQVTILTSQRSDHGSYEFEIITTANVVLRDTVELIVQFAPSLTNVSHDQTVREESNMQLFCEAIGKPEPNITWTRVLEDGSNDEILHQDPIWGFPNINRTASGTYRCTADNGFGNPVNHQIKVNVTYPAKIVKLASEHEVAAQQSVSLQCTAEGNPQPTYTWTPCDPRQSVCHQSTINTPEVLNDSNYSCNVANFLGSDTRNTTLFIAGNVINVTLAITSESCTEGKYNETLLWRRLNQTITKIFSGKNGYISAKLINARCGSLIVDLALKFNSAVRETKVLSILRDATKNGMFGDFNVSAITGTRHDTGITTTMATTPTSSSDMTVQACGDCACSCTVLGVVIGILVVVIIALVVYVLWLHKKGAATRDRVNRAASNEESGKMNVGIYRTKQTNLYMSGHLLDCN